MENEGGAHLIVDDTEPNFDSKEQRGQGHESTSECEHSKPRSDGSQNFNFRDEWLNLEVPYSDLKDATNDFNKLSEIGKGGFGKVHLGKLGGQMVAIKILDSTSTQGEREFFREIEVLHKMRHRHLVKLVGACFQARALVYEYLPNGSLEDCLRESPTILTWEMRTRIISEICLALSYLHSKSVIHTDLKPANVLLDANFKSKLSDFGLCRFLPENMVTAPFLETSPMGTPGYTDPWFLDRCILRPGSDLYSLGITVLKLLTGMSPIGLGYKMSKTDETSLPKMIDPTAGEWPFELAKEMVYWSLQCCYHNENSSEVLTDMSTRLSGMLAEIEAFQGGRFKPLQLIRYGCGQLEPLSYNKDKMEVMGTANAPLSLSSLEPQPPSDDGLSAHEQSTPKIATQPQPPSDDGLSAHEQSTPKIATQVLTHAIGSAPGNIDTTLNSADVILGQFDIIWEAEAKILKGPHEDLESYLEAIDQLRSSMNFFSSNQSSKSSDGVLNHANSLLTMAIMKLEEEYMNLLSSYSKPVEPDHLFECLPNSLRPSAECDGKNTSAATHSEHQAKAVETDIYKPPTLIPPKILSLLHGLAQQMVQAGNQQQCLKIYGDTRASALELSLQKLGVEKLSKLDVQKMQWEVLESEIGNWIHFMRIAVKLLFAAERKICDQIFEGINSVLKDQCFAEVTADSVLMLHSFGEAIAKSKWSPEKLFVLLDMYEIMRELQPEIEIIFEGKACNEMREKSLSLTRCLAQTAQETFRDFEEAVEKDDTKTDVQDGNIHPLTSYVINYVKFSFDYLSALKEILQEFETGKDSNSQPAVLTMRILQALQSNLDGKSRQYKDSALTHLFLMNNIHYMVRSLRRSEGKDLLGDDWFQRHRRIVQLNANQYKRVAWAKILQTLSAQGLSSSGGGTVGSEGGSSSGVSRTRVKERFISFNMQFEELYRRQSQWTVPDLELRESLRLVVAEVLCPAYKAFTKRFGPQIDNEKNPQKYVKYTPKDLEQMLGDLQIDNEKNPQKYVKYTPEDLEQMLGDFFEGKKR